MFNNLIQVAGIRNLAEAELVCNSGASLIGFPLYLKDGREDSEGNKDRTLVERFVRQARIGFDQQR